MIKLFQFPANKYVPNMSVYCLKLETYFRMAEIPYENVRVNDPRKSPKGKLPHIEIDGKKIGDSTLIIEHLRSVYGDSLDQHLTIEQQSLRTLIRTMTEEHLGWVVIYSRWQDPKGWEATEPLFFGTLPFGIRALVGSKIRKMMIAQLHAQGMGRHTADEVYTFGCQDVDVLSQLLAKQQFFFGDTPTSIDATVYAFVANILFTPIENPLKKHTQQLQNLVAYCERMQRTYYPEMHAQNVGEVVSA